MSPHGFSLFVVVVVVVVVVAIMPTFLRILLVGERSSTMEGWPIPVYVSSLYLFDHFSEYESWARSVRATSSQIPQSCGDAPDFSFHLFTGKPLPLFWWFLFLGVPETNRNSTATLLVFGLVLAVQILPLVVLS